jgi:hypothetical protein
VDRRRAVSTTQKPLPIIPSAKARVALGGEG